MDAEQESRANPFGMDEECQHCPALCETREQVVHGYGDVGGDFLVLGESPSAATDETGIPFASDDERAVLSVLEAVGLPVDHDVEPPDLENAFLTHITRCHHPDRGPTDEEVGNCEPFLNSELRMMNPEIILPVGQRALEALAFEYTTRSAEDLDVADQHATTIRGRGFEIIPVRDPATWTEDHREALAEHLADTLGRDYRQTKGRRGR